MKKGSITVLRVITAFLIALTAVGPLSAGQRFDVKTIPIGGMPGRILPVPSLGLVFVSVDEDHVVQVLDGGDDRIVATIPTGFLDEDEPRLLSFDPLSARLLVITAGKVKSYEQDGLGFRLMAERDIDLTCPRVRDFTFPCSVTFDAAHKRLFLTDPLRSGIRIIEGDSLDFRVEYENDLRAWDLTLDSSGLRVIVPNAGSSAGAEVAVLEASTLQDLGRYDASEEVYSAAYQSKKERVYTLIKSLPNLLQYLDVATGESWPIAVGKNASSLVLDEARDIVYVANFSSPFLSKIDGADVDARLDRSTPIPLDDPARTVILDAGANLVYAIDDLRSKVSVIDTRTDELIGSYQVGLFPRHAALDTSSHKLYVTNTGDGTVSILSLLASPGRSQVLVDKIFITADAKSTAKVTVIPRDDNGDLLGSGHKVVISTTAGTLLGTVVDEGDGRYTRDLQASLLPETAIISASVDGVDLDTRPRVSFEKSGWGNIRHADPDWGIVAGDTRVVISGSGFLTKAKPKAGPALQVFFGGAEAQIESVTDNEIVCRTPPHAVGVVDIELVKFVSDEKRVSWLRGGYTYVDGEQFSLRMTETDREGEVYLRWADSPTGPVRMLRSTSPDFSQDVSETPSLAGPDASEIAPIGRVLYYRIER